MGVKVREELSRRDRAAIGALAHAIEHEPALRPVVAEDYGVARKHIHHLRELLERQRQQRGRHPDEPGSKSAIRYRDGLAPYGTVDTTGFSDGLF